MVGGTPSIGGGFPGGAMSAHSDVLGASPSTSSDRLALVEELKRRGRISISSGNFPEADLLYGRAIEVMTSDAELRQSHAKDLAVLHANRSMAGFHQHNFDGSLADARVAMDLDPSYMKGYWRAGQALAGLDRCEEAVEVYERALRLEGTNKAISKEVAKLRKRIEDEKRLMEKAEEATEVVAGEPSSGKPMPSSQPPAKKAATATTAATAPKSKDKASKSKDKASTKGDVDDDVTFTDSDAVRGYKIVGGKKTSYFHHEMTDEEKRLIGDIAPKKLDVGGDGAAAVADMDVDGEEKKGGTGTSAWNKAGTWEERDVTGWAKETLTASLLSARFELPVEPRSVVTVTDVGDLEGHASVATVRGKRRFIFEFAFKLHWRVPLSNDDGDRKATGTMTFPDVDGTCDGEYDMSEYTVGSDSPPEARHLLDRFVRNGGLRDEVTKALNEWVQLFEATYAL